MQGADGRGEAGQGAAPAARLAGPPVFARRVYYADTDAGGVMYHARYFEFAEAARTEALRAADVPHDRMVCEHGVSFIVQRAEIAYERPARLDELVTIRTLCLQAGGASVRLSQEFFCGGARLAVLALRLGCVSVTDFRPARLPPRWRAAMLQMIPPEAAGRTE